jgi:ABC-2 type transport system permease protein
MRPLAAMTMRELAAYARSPLAFVFTAVFLAAAGALCLEIGGLIDLGVADLATLFAFLPWLFLVFMPALAMRQWAEEIASGAIETTLALPAPLWALVAGKFLAAWAVAGAGLVLTMPLWIAISVLGAPDHGPIAVGYLTAFLIAGAYLAIGAAASALSGSAVTAFVAAAGIGFVFTAAGLPVVLDAARSLFGPGASDAIAAFSLLEAMDAGARGVIEAPRLVFLLGLIGSFLMLATVWLDARRGGR